MAILQDEHQSASQTLEAKEIERLRTEIDILRNIIAMIPGNVFWKDNEGKYLGCNNNVAQLFGFESLNGIIGKRTNQLLGSQLAELVDHVDNIVTLTATENYVEEAGLDINNNPATYLTKKLPLYDKADNVIGLLGVSFDITKRKKMEEDLKIAKEKAEASSRAKTQFLAVVNHELRTPLASIVGLTDFLKQGSLTKAEEKSIIEAIENCTQHLLNLVNDVLDFSRLETGKYHIRTETVNLNALLYEVYGITKTLARKKGLKLRIHSGPNIPQNVISDSRILRQILINLVSNGIKFTDKGHITINLQNLSQTSNKICLEIGVKDTGTGIPSDKLKVIFEPFQQLEDAYKRQSSRSGTGLGLAIVEKLAALIGAKVQVMSQYGKGSFFSLIGEFTVPKEDMQTLMNPQMTITVKTKQSHRTRTSSKAIYPHFISKKPRILLIEDDPIVQFVHKKMLGDLGCEVDAFSHGQEAIRMLKEHDIIFVDISLPDISGFDVIKTLRKKQSAKPTPIIALTVYTGKEEKHACLKAGANEFASKPISPAHLKRILLRYLKESTPPANRNGMG